MSTKSTLRLTSELIGPALDWAVAKALGKEVWKAAYGGIHLLDEIGFCETKIFQPSVKWSQGGPIIEREKISVMWGMDDIWHACNNFSTLGHLHGPTPLIAAMRCYVASKLGNEIDIPDELI